MPSSSAHSSSGHPARWPPFPRLLRSKNSNCAVLWETMEALKSDHRRQQRHRQRRHHHFGLSYHQDGQRQQNSVGYWDKLQKRREKTKLEEVDRRASADVSRGQLDGDFTSRSHRITGSPAATADRSVCFKFGQSDGQRSVVARVSGRGRGQRGKAGLLTAEGHQRLHGSRRHPQICSTQQRLYQNLR